MVLVLFLIELLFLLLCVVEILMLSSIKLKVRNSKLQIILYAFGKIPIIIINTNKNIIKEKVKNLNNKGNIKIDKTLIKIAKNLSPKIEKLNLKMEIGIQEAAYTSFAVFAINAIISTILPYLVEAKNIPNIKYEVIPIYRR